jgi:hypothetical protein
MHSIAAFVPAPQILRRRPCMRSGEVFVMSGSGFYRLPLENQQIEFRRFADKAG